MSQRDKVAKIVIALAEYYDKILSTTQLAMYVEDLVAIEPEDLIKAVRIYRNDPKNERFPLPAKLKAMVVPANTDEDQARDASARIIASVSKFGPYQEQRAKEYIGELGWLVVQRQGGWRATVEALTYDNQGQLQAQWRDLALSLARRSKLGLVDQAPELPQKNQGSLESFGVKLKLLTESERT